MSAAGFAAFPAGTAAPAQAIVAAVMGLLGLQGAWLLNRQALRKAPPEVAQITDP
jgi:hypothetical protein